MDFRKCPACQASVLEDDVDDCPFCGSSMTGKPQAAKPASAKQAAATPASPSARKPTAPKAPASAKSKGTEKGAEAAAGQGDDDPFEVDTTAMRKALKLVPRPTKGRTYEIVCPMCETKGFLDPKDAGKDVQCANPKCIVPVFKSKRPKVEAPPEPEPQSKKGLIIGVAGVVLLGVGFGIFSMLSPQKPINIGTNGTDFPPTPRGPEECDDCKPEVCDDCKPEQITLPEILKQSLVKVVDAARDRGDHNRNAGTQLAAETLAVAGSLAEALTELKRLQSAGSSTGYLQLQPFAEMAWTQLNKNDITGATKSATDGLARSKSLPPTVRRSLDSVTSLAAVLVAIGKTAEATQLITDQITEAEGSLGARGDASVLWRTALDSGTYDVGLEASRPYHILMPESLRIGVVETLVAHGYPKESLSLIHSTTDVASQDACRAAWAGRLAEIHPETVTAQVITALEGQNVSPTGQARVWAAVASHLSSRQKEAPAQAALALAVAAAEKIPAPVPVNKLTTKQIYESDGKAFLGLKNPSQEKSSALAYADLALVYIQFGQLETATKFMERSMTYARASTPGPSFTQQLFNECQTQEGTVRSKLQGDVNVGSSETALINAFNRYRRQCLRFNDMAQARLNFQVDLLRALVKAGLHQEVWEYILAQDSKTDPHEREPYLAKNLPGLLIVQADLNKKPELKKAILASRTIKPEIDVVDAGVGQARLVLQQGDWKKSAELLRGFYKSASSKANRDRADIDSLALIADAMQQLSVIETFQYLTTLTDPVLRQDAFMLLAADSTQAGTAPQLWEHLKTPAIRELSPLDRAAIYRGFATGITAAK